MTDVNPSPPAISTYRPGALGKIIELHGSYYARQWNFGLFFEAKVARELSELLTPSPHRENGFWIASIENRVVGSIAIDRDPEKTGEARLRFFIVDPSAAGLGIGNRLMETAMSFCRESRISYLFLTTFAGLDAARHLYEKWGFKLISEEEDTTWGPLVREQRFELLL